MPLVWFSKTSIGKAVLGPYMRNYQNRCLRAMAAMGLRAEDFVRVGEMGDIGKQAVALMPEHAQEARIRRLIRAQDLANKHLELTEAQQKQQQPLKQDLMPVLRHLMQRDLERKTYK